jgi:L-ascorbate metabolism protein UlaG (beta-lactamase superfamily)
MVEIGGKNILFDPFISPNPQASAIDISTINPDVILISHGHGDHIADAVAIGKQSEAQVIAAFEITEWLQANGLENCVPMNTGGVINLGFCEVKMVNAVHSSSLPDGSYGGNPVGFVITAKGKSFYYAGDTALHVDMKLIADEFNIDFAFLPIGDHFTMGIKDAALAAQFVHTAKVIGMHFDTFPPIEINHQYALETFENRSVQLVLPKINQKLEY